MVTGSWRNAELLGMLQAIQDSWTPGYEKCDWLSFARTIYAFVMSQRQISTEKRNRKLYIKEAVRKERRFSENFSRFRLLHLTKEAEKNEIKRYVHCVLLKKSFQGFCSRIRSGFAFVKEGGGIINAKTELKHQ